MKSSPELLPNWRDGVAVLLIVVLALLCAAWTWGGTLESGTALTAVFTNNGGTLEKIPLAGLQEERRTLSGNGYTLQVILTEEGVWVESADCPTQDCVHTGRISRSGQSIVCLPARIIVRLEGGAPAADAPDILIG